MIKLAVINLYNIYDEFEKEMVQKVKKCRRYLYATNASIEIALTWTAQDILQFIIKWDFIESLC